MRRRVPACLAASIALIAISCVAPEPESEPEPEPNKETTFAYDCEGTYVVTRTEGLDKLWVFLPGQTVALKHVRAASGARYEGDGVLFWSHGDEAMLEVPGSDRKNCSVDRRASILEDAKLRGVDFRGTGNEPGWVLEIGPDRILFSYDYGEGRAVFPMLTPEQDNAGRRTVYSGRNEEHAIRIMLAGESCADTMSDETFETTVEVTLGDRKYRGCGQPLH